MIKSFKPDPRSDRSSDVQIEVQFCADDMVMVDFPGEPISNQAVEILCRRLQKEQPSWLIEPVAGLTTLAARVQTPLEDAARNTILSALLQWAEESRHQDAPVGRMIELPICYDPSVAPDLDSVAELTGLSPQEIRAIHQAPLYRAALMGFTPGFAYLNGLDSRLAVPRLAMPRANVPDGAVGITGNRCAVYPRATPGGWHLIGRCPTRLFNPDQSSPSLIRLGDQVRFVEITKTQFDRLWAQR
jgi:inhibitor of KinA